MNMIRGFARPIRRLVAQFAMAAVFLSGVPTFAAARPFNVRDGKLINISTEQQRLPTIAETQQIARELESKGVLKSDRLKPFRVLVAIGNASNSQSRGALIWQLPVSVVRTETADGLTVKNFIARGKVRLSVIERPRGARNDDAVSSPLRSGPAAEDRDPCFEDEEEPCATEAEMDELAMLSAYSQAEMEWLEQETYAEIDAYCSENPSMCLADEHGFQSGPYVACEFNCVADGFVAAGSAIVAAGTAVGAGVKHGSAVAAGKTLSVATLSLWGAAIVGTALVAVGSYHIWNECRAQVRVPVHGHTHLFEPVY